MSNPEVYTLRNELVRMQILVSADMTLIKFAKLKVSVACD